MLPVILAAGMGTRLRPYTDARPKVMTPFLGRPILHWQQECLRQFGMADQLTVMGGYKSEVLEGETVKCIINPDYDRTSMVYTLFQGQELFHANEDLLVLYGDIVYRPDVIAEVINTPGRIVTAVNLEWRPLWEARFEDPLQDAESLILNGDTISEIGQKVSTYDRIQGQFAGIIKFRADIVSEFWLTWGETAYGHPDTSILSNMYMTDFLQLLINVGETVRAAMVQGGWLEIDSVEDLRLYEDLARRGKLKAVTGLDFGAP